MDRCPAVMKPCTVSGVQRVFGGAADSLTFSSKVLRRSGSNCCESGSSLRTARNSLEPWTSAHCRTAGYSKAKCRTFSRGATSERRRGNSSIHRLCTDQGSDAGRNGRYELKAY